MRKIFVIKEYIPNILREIIRKDYLHIGTTRNYCLLNKKSSGHGYKELSF